MSVVQALVMTALCEWGSNILSNAVKDNRNNNNSLKLAQTELWKLAKCTREQSETVCFTSGLAACIPKFVVKLYTLQQVSRLWYRQTFTVLLI